MTAPQSAKRKFLQIHLSTAILLMLAMPVFALVFLRGNAWYPERTAMTLKELKSRFPVWCNKAPATRGVTPDGTRSFSTYQIDNWIYDARNDTEYEGRLFDFTDYDSDSDFELRIGLKKKNVPRHFRCGFVDDDRCVFVFYTDDSWDTPYFRVWERRFPERLLGHLYRPEVWIAGIFTALFLWRVVQRFREVSRQHRKPVSA
jgi:hypothetical protein